MKIISAYTRDHFETMETLGRRIVPVFYAQYLPPERGAWLAGASHTLEAFERQVGEGYRHYMVEAEGETIGYFALHEEGQTMVLSQFYLLTEWRGRGIGQRVMDFVHEQANELRVRRVEVLVLQKNAPAVGMYRKNGYRVTAEVLTPMGDEGQTVEDYLMHKSFDRQ